MPLAAALCPVTAHSSQTSSTKGISSLSEFSNQSPCFTRHAAVFLDLTVPLSAPPSTPFCSGHAYHSPLRWPCLVFASFSSPSQPFAGGSAPPTNPLTPHSLHCYPCTQRASSYRARGKKIRVPFLDNTKETFSLVCEQMDF